MKAGMGDIVRGSNHDGINVMMRSREAQARYDAYRQGRQGSISSDCQFCDADELTNVTVEALEHFRVITNRFEYEVWDGCDVAEHLLLVPKRHTDALSSLTADELDEWLSIVAHYESRCFSFYARAAGCESKSVPHQHTHLLRLGRHRQYSVEVNFR